MIAKIVSLCVAPLGTSLLLLVLSLALLLRPAASRWRRVGAWLGILALGWLYIWSTPVAGDALRGLLENQAGPRSLESIPRTPVAVVLGGGVWGPRLPKRPDPDLRASADRVWHAARLYHAGKVERLVLSGGTVRTGDGSEAEAMQRFLLDLGVPAKAITLESGSLTTSDNAALTVDLLRRQGIDTMVLVTSAFHMPRARRGFERRGVQVIPAPTDFEVAGQPFDILRIFPDAGSLDNSALVMKELVGRVVGR